MHDFSNEILADGSRVVLLRVKHGKAHEQVLSECYVMFFFNTDGILAGSPRVYREEWVGGCSSIDYFGDTITRQLLDSTVNLIQHDRRMSYFALEGRNFNFSRRSPTDAADWIKNAVTVDLTRQIGLDLGGSVKNFVSIKGTKTGRTSATQPNKANTPDKSPIIDLDKVDRYHLLTHNKTFVVVVAAKTGLIKRIVEESTETPLKEVFKGKAANRIFSEVQKRLDMGKRTFSSRVIVKPDLHGAKTAQYTYTVTRI